MGLSLSFSFFFSSFQFFFSFFYFRTHSCNRTSLIQAEFSIEIANR
jgi:hypothetical protein